MQPKYRKILLFSLIVIVLTIRIFYLQKFEASGGFKPETAYDNGDAGHYLSIAKTIASQNVYSDNGATATESATWRSPLWPFILSFFFRITNDLYAIMLFKIIVEMGLMLWIFIRLKRHLKLSDWWFFPLFLLFLEPHLVKYETTFLTESFTAILLLAVAALFITANPRQKPNLFFPVLCALAVLCHPVSFFFIATLMAIYHLNGIKAKAGKMVLSAVVFIVIVGLWPVRNHLTFGKGLYLTASQGATFSKGWNDRVTQDFNNVDGDWAHEGNNLKYLAHNEPLPANSPVGMSKIYHKATMLFIKQSSFGELSAIAFKKIKSNFNPVAEVPKPGAVETIGMFARAMYLLNFVALAVYAIKFRRNASPLAHKIFAIILAVFAGQLLMSVYIYTGLRFNAVYGLVSLACLIFLFKEFLGQKRPTTAL